jgi:hypothetical protein
MKPFLAGVETTVVVLFVSLFFSGIAITGGQGVFPQVIDCRYHYQGGGAVWMEIGSTREHGEFVTFRALGCTGYWHVNPRT